MTLMRSWKFRLAVAVVVVLAVAAVAAWWLAAEPDIDDAIAILSDERNFQSAVQSGDSFARVSDILLDSYERCMAADVPDVEACGYLSSASVNTNRTAFAVLSCTPAVIDSVRRPVLAHLRAVAEDPHSEDIPGLPRPPAC